MTDLLRVDQLTAGYGALPIIREVSFTLAQGEALAILGRNGVGKTTLIESIVGLTRHFAGTVTLNGADITPLPPNLRAQAGIGWVPQTRGIFRSLSVRENLAATARPGPWTAERVLSLFPRLAQRASHMGDQLSGGEQQMLAIGRALILNPAVMLLDEPTEGLAPVIVDTLTAALAMIRREGMAFVVVEQHARVALGMTDRALILDRGQIVDQGDSAEMMRDPARLDLHLGVSARLPVGTPSP